MSVQLNTSIDVSQTYQSQEQQKSQNSKLKVNQSQSTQIQYRKPVTLWEIGCSPWRTPWIISEYIEQRKYDLKLILFSLIKDGKLEEASIIIEENPHIKTSEAGKKLIQWIIEDENAKGIDYLGHNGFRFDHIREGRIGSGSNFDKRTPVLLYSLVNKKNLSFEALLNIDNIDLETTDPENEKEPLLHMITRKNNEYACDAYLKKCAKKDKLKDVVNKVHDNASAIMLALTKKNIYIFQKLAQVKETDLSVKHSDTKKTLLFIVGERNDTQSFSLLMNEYKSRSTLESVIDETDKSGESLLFYAARRDNNYLLQELMKSGADLTKRQTKTNRTLLHIFSNNNDANNFSIFMEEAKKKAVLKSIIDLKDSNGETALFIAARKNNFHILEQLIKVGADYQTPINGKTPQEASPKFFCCQEQSNKLLWNVLHGNDIPKESGKTESSGNSGVTLCSSSSTLASLDESKKNNALILCLNDGTFEQAQKLIYDGVNLNIPNEDGNGPLFLVIKNKNRSEKEKLELIKLIRQKGDNVNRHNANKETLLIIAIRKGYYEIVKDLMIKKVDTEKNCDLSLQDEMGNTALHHAVEKGHYKMVKRLLKIGASANAINLLGQTPLHLTQDQGIANLLILKGCADTTIKDKNGKLPIDYAAMTVRSDQIAKSIISGSPNITTHERAEINGNKETAKLMRAKEKNGEIAEDDITPKHEQKSDTLSGFIKDSKNQLIDQTEKGIKNAIKEGGEALGNIKTEAIKTGQETVVSALKAANLPGKASDLVSTVTTAAFDKTKDSILKKIKGEDDGNKEGNKS